jgi:hypothetical protein
MTDIIDKTAMALSGGLILLGVVGLGIVELVAGKPYGAVPLTNEAGEVIATPMVDPNLRVGLVLAGLAVLGLYGLYRLAAPIPPADETADKETTAH